MTDKPKRSKYEVVGPRVVADAQPGETIELDEDDPRTQALIDAGHVKRVSGGTAKRGPQDTDAA